MTNGPAIGSLPPGALGKRVTTVCPNVLPAWATYEHPQLDMAILATSMVLVQHTLETVPSGKRLVRRRRRIVVGLS